MSGLIGFTSFRKHIVLTLASILLSVFTTSVALATELPFSVYDYLKRLDPQVKVRFDGLIQFTNGEQYLPVIPSDPKALARTSQVIAADPAKTTYPDIVEFDNHLFLLRLIKLPSGIYTLPIRGTYPLAMQEGMLPQDLLLPENLRIPTELKVILGSLPYNPASKADVASASSAQPAAPAPVIQPAIPAVQPATTSTLEKPSVNSTVNLNKGENKPFYSPTVAELNPLLNGAAVAASKTIEPLPYIDEPLLQGAKESEKLTLYVADLDKQAVTAFDPNTQKNVWTTALECLPSHLNRVGRYLFATCLNSNQMAVIDIPSNLIKARVDVGAKPSFSLNLESTKQVLVSNRFDPFLSVIDPQRLIAGNKIPLPGNGNIMVEASRYNRVFVADALEGKIYQVDPTQQLVERTLTANPNISDMVWLDNVGTQGELWVTSRTKHEVQRIDPIEGTILSTFKVGEKPIALVHIPQLNKVLVLSANTGNITIFNLAPIAEGLAPTEEGTIALNTEDFPSAMALAPSGRMVYITTIGDNTLFMVDPLTRTISKKIAIEMHPLTLAIGGGQPAAQTIYNQTAAASPVKPQAGNLGAAAALKQPNSPQAQALNNYFQLTPATTSKPAAGSTMPTTNAQATPTAQPMIAKSTTLTTITMEKPVALTAPPQRPTEPYSRWAE